MYMSYVKNCKFTSPTTLPIINFMQRSLVEMYAIDVALTYQYAFVYIRQLAIHLRNAIKVKKQVSCCVNICLAPGRSECDSKNVIFNRVLLIGIIRSSHDNALRWMPRDLTDDKSTLVQVMAWCRQATGQYLNQCWPRSVWPYGVTRPQWVKE